MRKTQGTASLLRRPRCGATERVRLRCDRPTPNFYAAASIELAGVSRGGISARDKRDAALPDKRHGDIHMCSAATQ